MRSRVTEIILGALIVAAAPAAPARAVTPTEQLRASIDRVLQLLQDPELGEPERIEERRKEIRDIANETFDWQETGKRALARHWQARTSEERSEFSSLFADLIERSYVGKIEVYNGEKIAYARESIENDQATVQTRLLTKDGTEIPIDYRMYRAGDRWRVYDVLIEGVSLVGNYRSQFNRIITQSGYDELVNRMKSKQEELEFEDTERGKKGP